MIAIIDYKAGNLRSVERALLHLGQPCSITADAAEILAADRVIFPGVGAAGSAMASIDEAGLAAVIRSVVGRGTPFLGICLGAQIILGRSEENNGIDCIGLVAGTARRFPEGPLKVPHIGWNSIALKKAGHPLFRSIDSRAQFYFVHSYYPAPERPDDVVATTDYGCVFASVIGNGNMVATQFHPEKSGESGLRLLKNFCEWNGTE